jgi:hypothetical protein
LVFYEAARREDDAASAERLEVERAATSWHSLLAGSVGSPIDLVMCTGSAVAGQCVDVGRMWCLVDCETTHALVMVDQVVSLTGAHRVGSRSVAEPGAGSVLRRWARLGMPVSVELVTAERVRGVVAEVLSDALAIATDTEPSRRVMVPLTAVVTVRGPRLELD